MMFMKKMVSRILLVASMSVASAAALAEDTTVNAVGVKFDPVFVFIEVGDKVSWENMTGHNVETIDELVPEGTEKINSTLGEDITLTFNEPGVFVYKCTPHWGARMGGIIVVGQTEDAMNTAEAYLAKVDTLKGNLLPAKGLLKKFMKELESRT